MRLEWCAFNIAVLYGDISYFLIYYEMETRKYLVWVLLIFISRVSANLKKHWWRYTQIYEVFIWSFKDSNGDGIGDIKGVTSTLDHFVDLNIEALWISPFFKSPLKSMGYDVSNYTTIDPTFGTFDDFQELVNEMKKRGMKLVLDLVINHSSNDNEWFVKSENGTKPYDNYYVWKDAKNRDQYGNPVPPNNWQSLTGESVWKWSDKRNKFYLHQFTEDQPDLNLRDKNLKTEIKKIIEFWLNKGVSGFRLDAAKHYMEDLLFRDEPLADPNYNKPYLSSYNDLLHIYTTNLPETYEFLHEMRKFIDSNYKKEDKILIAEAYTDMNHTMQYYGTKEHPVVHFPFNFAFTGMRQFPNLYKLDYTIRDWLTHMPPGAVANWVAENHDNYRLGDLLSEEFMDISTTLVMMLPGIACIYYGQEIGMTSVNGGTAPPSSDRSRLPMQWDSSMNAGFSSKRETWMQMNPNYWRVNVRSQKKKRISRYHMFKKLSALRKTVTGKLGVFESYIITPWVYAFTRSYPGEPTYIILLNLGSEMELINLRYNISKLPKYLTVVTASINLRYISGSKLLARHIPMRPVSSVVFAAK